MVKKSMQHDAAEKLYTKTAQEIYKQLHSANPHNWHIKGRNRFNSGDWQKKA